jgi:hypothetical protein
MEYITSLFSKLTQGSLGKSADASTRDPAHQLRSQFLHYGLASVRTTLKDLNEQQAARWSATTQEDKHFSADSGHFEMVSDVLFDNGQVKEPNLESWNWAIDTLEKSWNSYKDPKHPRDEVEFKDEDDFQSYDLSVRSDLNLMRQIATVKKDNPTQQ